VDCLIHGVTAFASSVLTIILIAIAPPLHAAKARDNDASAVVDGSGAVHRSAGFTSRNFGSDAGDLLGRAEVSDALRNESFKLSGGVRGVLHPNISCSFVISSPSNLPFD
jgi:hypothetical protein